MIKRLLPAFSLIELLIALALSAVIMMGLAQANRNAARLLRQAQNLLVINRQAALFFNQLERDVTAAIPYQKAEPYAPEKKEKKGADAAAEPAPVKAENKQKEEKYIPSCVLEVAEDGMYKVGTKKWQQLKKITFITTTPLDVYEQEQVAMVRVQYQLIVNKKLSTKQKKVYMLERLQTSELENVQCTEDPEKKNKKISRCIVADAVKQFSLEASFVPKPAQKKGGEVPRAAEDPEPMKVFVWGEKEEREKSKTHLPEHFSAHIAFWDNELEQSYSFTSLLPVFVKSDVLKENKEKEKEATVTESAAKTNAPKEEKGEKDAS